MRRRARLHGCVLPAPFALPVSREEHPDVRPTIETSGQRCRRSCARTFRYERVGGLHGTLADPSDVRRCGHQRIWICTGTTEVGFVAVDVWEQLSPVWTPVRYRRAVRALRSTTASERKAQ
jgi:hypothetical protein